MKKLRSLSVLFAVFLLAGSPVLTPGTARADEVLSTSNTNGKAEQRFNVYLTGYSYWDNTPPGSSAISKPVVHRRAGGKGTWKDPITIAVGHRIVGGRQYLDYPAGTRFYLPSLRRYAVVEDVCGDGPTPQNGPCHTGHNGLPWLDIYVDGKRASESASHACMNRITRVQTIIENPSPNYPVAAGPLTESGCQLFQG
jgi:hypothetical protein